MFILFIVIDPLLTALNARGPLGSGLCAVLELVLGVEVEVGVDVGVLPPVGMLAGNRNFVGLRLQTMPGMGGTIIFEGDGDALKDLG